MLRASNQRLANCAPSADLHVRAALYRCDLKLDLSPAVGTVLAALATSCASDVSIALDCIDPGMCELSAISSDPGARAQPLHCDTSAAPTSEGEQHGGERAQLITAFVPLSDIAVEMGPTRMLPGTHTPAAHELARTEGARGLAREHPPVVMNASAGDVILMDSRLWHCGGANRATRRRTLLVASFTKREGGRCCPPGGSTLSLLPHLRDTLSLTGLASASGSASSSTSTSAGCSASAESRVDTRRAELHPAVLSALARLVATLPPDPRVASCTREIGAALNTCLEKAASKVDADADADVESQSDAGSGSDAESSEAGVEVDDGASVPVAVLEHLMRLRVLGPHLRASPRWSPLMRHVDEALERCSLSAMN